MAAETPSLGARLRQRRAELGLSQAEAARELDVARTAYRLWEMEAAKPSPDRWRLIARWLGVPVSTMLVAEELLTEDEAPPEATAAWERAELRKALPLDDTAPAAARAALEVTASGIPSSALADAMVLVSELVTCAVVTDGDVAGRTIALSIVVPRDRVRVDATVELDGATAGFPVSDVAVRLLTVMAAGWGTSRGGDGRATAWFEVDVPLPGE